MSLSLSERLALRRRPRPAPEPPPAAPVRVIPDVCRRRGHTMRLNEQWSFCINEGCPEQHPR